MKNTASFFVFAVLSVLPIWAAPQYAPNDPYANVERVAFSAKKGEWGNPRNWNNGKVPEGVVCVQIPGGSMVTVSTPLYNIDGVNVGSTPDKHPGVLYIENPVQAKFSLIFVPAVNREDLHGELYLRGGDVSVGNDKDGGGVLCVGYGLTYSGVGYAEISGGKFRGGMKVGNDAPNTQTGTLVVKGEAPDIATNKNANNFIMLGASGTLVFELDAKGVAGLHYKGARVYVSSGALIRVDGKNYKGGTKTFNLIEADVITHEGARLETVNFPAGTTATLSWVAKGKEQSLLLKLSTRRE